jgi:hypothetical protein
MGVKWQPFEMCVVSIVTTHRGGMCRGSVSKKFKNKQKMEMNKNEYLIRIEPILSLWHLTVTIQTSLFFFFNTSSGRQCIGCFGASQSYQCRQEVPGVSKL